MNLKNALVKDCVSLALSATSKETVIDELIDVLDSAGKLSDREAVRSAVMDREKKMSTGMQNGIAIPHGKSPSVDSLVAAVGIHPDGLDFDSIDGLPCTIFILTVSPVNRTGPHIQFLAEVSRVLHEESVRQDLLAADTPEKVVEILTRP